MDPGETRDAGRETCNHVHVLEMLALLSIGAAFSPASRSALLPADRTGCLRLRGGQARDHVATKRHISTHHVAASRLCSPSLLHRSPGGATIGRADQKCAHS